MSVIYKSLKEIKGMKSSPNKGGGLRPPKKPGAGRRLILIVCVVVVATLILGITGYLIMTELEPTGKVEQAGPNIAEIQKRRAQKQAAEAQKTQQTPLKTAAVKNRSAAQPDNIIDPLDAPVNATVVLGESDGTADDSKGDSATGNQSSNASAKSDQRANASKKTYDVKLPPEPVSEEEKEAAKEKNFLSKVHRNQLVMKLQKRLDRARKFNDAAGVKSALDKIRRLLGPNSFLILQWEGNLAVMSKDYAAAEQKYRRALTLKPYDLHCRMNLVLALIGGSKFTAADREILSLHRDFPDNEGVAKLQILLDYRKSHAPPKPLINDLHRETPQPDTTGNTSEGDTTEKQHSVQ